MKRLPAKVAAERLGFEDHNRDWTGMRYVYPVVSRRSGGVSLGINLNPNNACNWHCVYCQVPDLKRGGPPPVDIPLLEAELRRMLDWALRGDFMSKHVPKELRVLKDIAFSGNGEPTSAAEFPDAVACVGRVMADFGLAGKVNVVLITNGSLLDRMRVRLGIGEIARLGGEVWFKLDAATRAGMKRINGSAQDPERVFSRLRACAGLCRTWIQTCVFACDGKPPEAVETDAWLGFLARAKAAGIPLAGVLLYGLARPSLQAGAARLSRLPESWLRSLAGRVAALGIPVRQYP